MLRFQPKTDDQLNSLMPDGNYQFRVVDAVDMEKNGTHYIKLNLKVTDHLGGGRIIFPILHPSVEHIIKHFCDATGLQEKYQSGSLESSDCIGRTGLVKIYTKKDKTGDFRDKNEVSDYVPRESSLDDAKSMQPVPEEVNFNEEVPF